MTDHRVRFARILGAATAVAAVGLAGCGGDGALGPEGRGAESIADLWWVMLALSAIPLAIVLGFLARIVVVRRREREGERPPPGEAQVDGRRDRRLILLGGVVLPILLLLPVAAMTVYTGQARESDDDDAETLEVAVTGHQFWWDLEYPMPGSRRLDEGETFRTANELHVPVGRPVDLVLRSEDVIHSLWVPQVDGKMDLIPGRTNRMRIEARRPGTFQGYCAELCGLGHAAMRFVVVAHEEEQFEDWLERESAPADIEVDTAVRQEFANSCGVCHDVRGVYRSETFRGDFGPDLTHFAARRMLGAGLLPNTREALGRWIADPQGVKPGNKMPDVGLDGEELADMVDFLERLE